MILVCGDININILELSSFLVTCLTFKSYNLHNIFYEPTSITSTSATVKVLESDHRQLLVKFSSETNKLQRNKLILFL